MPAPVTMWKLENLKINYPDKLLHVQCTNIYGYTCVHHHPSPYTKLPPHPDSHSNYNLKFCLMFFIEVYSIFQFTIFSFFFHNRHTHTHTHAHDGPGNVYVLFRSSTTTTWLVDAFKIARHYPIIFSRHSKIE